MLPPTVVGYLLLRVLGPKRLIGAWVLETFGIRLVMTWWSAIFATVVVVFPLMYRTVRGAFEAFDETLAYAGQTLGLSNTYIFWHIRMPCCRQGVLAGAVLARILASEPRAILLDEPFSALDTFPKWNLGLELADLPAGFPGPILWVSHDLGECCRNCKTVCVMENGRSGAVTDMQELLRHPATQDAARLAGCRNFLPAHRCAEGVRLDGWALTLPLQTEDEQVTVAIPDSAVTLHAGPHSAVVSRVIRDLDAPLLRAALPKDTSAESGQAIRFDLRPEACLCYSQAQPQAAAFK